MGIELPTPFPGGNGSPENRTEGMFGARAGEVPASYGEIQSIGKNVEKDTSNYEPTQEKLSGAGVTDNSGQPTTYIVNDTSVKQSATVAALDDVPVVAADEDLIEKVWVDAVKGVITRTSGDPYARSAAIGKLQADYLQKRYGKTIGSE